MSDIGDNTIGASLPGIIQELLEIEAEKATLSERRKEIMAEVKAFGLTPKIVTRIIQRRKRKRPVIEEEDALLETYEHALDRNKLPW